MPRPPQASCSVRLSAATWPPLYIFSDPACLSNAFDAQAQAAAELQRRLDDSEASLRAAEERRDAAQRERALSDNQWADARARAAGAEARAIELDKRSEDLKEQLQECHREQQRMHDALDNLSRRCDQELVVTSVVIPGSPAN